MLIEKKIITVEKEIYKYLPQKISKYLNVRKVMKRMIKKIVMYLTPLNYPKHSFLDKLPILHS